VLALVAAMGLQPHSPVFVDGSQPVRVDAGEDFFIALPSNPTTGYSWSQSIGDGKIVAYEGNVYQPPATAAMGAGGNQLFIYHANRTGSTTITFAYARPFEPGEPPAKTTAFSVTVR
jgi:inhibitor of cysteine peptidase